jgi:hypothetical protein
MRKLLLVATGALGLTLAGLALAGTLNDAKSVRAVAGTFTATTVSHSQTRSCTTTDNKTISSTNATYSGIATGVGGEADLSGAITLDVRSTINTTDGVGVVQGKLKIAAAGGNTVAHLDAVYDHGAVAGLASGHARDPHAKLLCNLSAGFIASGTGAGFVNGKIGGGTGAGSAVELGPGRCAPTRPVSEKSEARGTVTLLTSTQITVAGLTCTIPTSLATKVANAVKLNGHAEIKCALQGGVNTLVDVKGK